MNAKRDKNTRKPAKGGNSRKSRPKSSGSAKKRQSNAETSRASAERVTTPETPTEEHINATFERMKGNSERGVYVSKPLTCIENDSAWAKLMSKHGVTRVMLLNCLHITRTTFKRALQYPSQYLTLHDLFFLPVLRA